MRSLCLYLAVLLLRCFASGEHVQPPQVPIEIPQVPLVTKNISIDLYNDLEELSRVVDIAYCVGTVSLGIQKPFLCASRCQDFKTFELVATWETGPLLSDSCGYIALSHPPAPSRIIVAFRGTYSLANTIIDLSTIPQEYVPYPGDDETEASSRYSKVIQHIVSRSVEPQKSRCDNCTVHAGFMTSWRNTRKEIFPRIEKLKHQYPDYELTLVGHSLGGAVAALASLDFKAKGWDPKVTTFGEPKVGNVHLAHYINNAFRGDDNDVHNAYRRVTHVDDPVPLLPLSEWGFHAHAGEIFISKSNLQPEASDIYLCEGSADPDCISKGEILVNESVSKTDDRSTLKGFKQSLVEAKGFLDIPARFRIWQLFFAHRDYFWRLGLCVPG